jgi:anti-sigma regulatory factor (Ser/Thr protein kinase)
MTEDLIWSVEDEEGVVLLEARGTLTLRSATELGATLRKLLMDRGRLIVDLTAVRVLWPAALAVFPTALAHAGGWPLARLVLVEGSGPLVGKLRAVGATAEVPVVADRGAAVREIERRPRRVRRSTDLPDGVIGPGFARALVRAVCADWEITEIEDRCAAVANELVTNATQHGGGRMVLLLTLDERGLTIGVQDGSAAEPVSPSVAVERGGFGMRVVEQLSESWGVLRHQDGKTVWALVQPEAGRPS